MPPPTELVAVVAALLQQVSRSVGFAYMITASGTGYAPSWTCDVVSMVPLLLLLQVEHSVTTDVH